MTGARVHVIGAGLAGLSSAVDLVTRGAAVRLSEATNQAGGRCRSYFDPQLGMEIDNGNHLLLTGNRSAFAYIEAIGSRASFDIAASARVPFVDLASGERWTIHANEGRLPWWILVPGRRAPRTSPAEHFALARLARARDGRTIGETIDCAGPLFEQLVGPFLLAALNIEPREGAAALAGAVMRETFMSGGRAFHPVVARDGLSKALVTPALDLVARAGGEISFGQRLRGLSFAGDRVVGLDFGEGVVPLAADETVILAVPAQQARALVPDLDAPDEFRAIVNAHFRLAPPAGLPLVTGVVNGVVEWLFAFPDRLSVTISAADRLLDTPRQELAERIWSDVAAIAGVGGPLPPFRIVREIRATFAATPAQERKRPPTRTRWRNLLLAGDWTRTGLPATIEGAIRSGVAAARAAVPP